VDDIIVLYLLVNFRVRLSKRRKTAGTAVAKSRLVVKHRDLADKELRAQVSLLIHFYL